MTAEQLKNSILQMAVQGKLVPQDPNDEPASELIKRIREEKENLIKEGKIKKEKNPSYIFRGEDNIPYEKVGKNEPVSIADEVPFEIPESWEWVRLGTLMSVISDGTHKTPTYVNEGVPFLSVQNISKGYFDLTKLKYITEEEHQTLIQRIKPQYGDILFCRIGTLGKAIKCTVDFEFSIFVSLGLLRPVISSITDYIVFAINSPLGDKWIQDNKVGGGTHTYKINLVDIPNMLIPLPPVAEQQRIFEKLTNLRDYIEAYNKAETKLSSMQNLFPENLKKSILQEAVMGKLVPQDENDEPASVLLERIREEKQRLIAEGKLKKDKHESIIYRRDNSHYEKVDGREICIDDEIPYDIPDSWSWCRVKNIFSLQAGKNIQASQIHGDTNGHDYLCYGGNGTRGYVGEYNHDGDYPIIGRQGALCGNINRATGKFYATEHAVCVDTYAGTDISWACLFLTALNLNQYATATAQPGLAVANINEVLIPLPPLEEQVRIVYKVESSFSVLTAL